jgi:hypothetical protein
VLAPIIQFSVHLLSINRYYDGRFISMLLDLLLFSSVHTYRRKFDVHGSVHRAMIMKVTNKTQLYKLIYYS